MVHPAEQLTSASFCSFVHIHFPALLGVSASLLSRSRGAVMHTSLQIE